jgi:Ran GTPase-activating protein (RanGAP) involved in mRNA processing and transport
MGRVISLNLSQNLFSDRVIDSFLDNINKVPNLKTLTLSQNKINQRTVKLRIDEAKKQDITITL